MHAGEEPCGAKSVRTHIANRFGSQSHFLQPWSCAATATSTTLRGSSAFSPSWHCHAGRSNTPAFGVTPGHPGSDYTKLRRLC